MFTLRVGSKCFLLTQKSRLMPGTVAGVDRRGLVDVSSPSGHIYTCNPDNVYDVETGRIMLMHSRAEKMAHEGYQIAVRLDRTFRVYQARKHGATGGWIVRHVGETLTCNCPAHTDACTCKHVMAVCSLLITRAARLRDRGNVRVATRYTNLAASITLAA